jgi:hypothetical protein
MDIAGYVSVCVQIYRILVFTVFHYMFRPTWPSSGADKHTRKEKTKITKENSTGTKHNGKHAECDHVKERQKKSAKQNPLSI